MIFLQFFLHSPKRSLSLHRFKKQGAFQTNKTQGRLAQLVQSIWFTPRGSAVRIRHRPRKLRKRTTKVALFFFVQRRIFATKTPGHNEKIGYPDDLHPDGQTFLPDLHAQTPFPALGKGRGWGFGMTHAVRRTPCVSTRKPRLHAVKNRSEIRTNKPSFRIVMPKLPSLHWGRAGDGAFYQ